MAEVKVLLSAAFKEAYVELVPQFERPDAARALAAFLSAPAAAPVIEAKGMHPITQRHG